jgi:hypothetical protein
MLPVRCDSCVTSGTAFRLGEHDAVHVGYSKDFQIVLVIFALVSGFTRTHQTGPPDRFGSPLRMSRAAAFCAGATLSSRSKISASASQSSALPIFFSLSAGTKQPAAMGHAGVLASNAVRRQRATSSPRWLKLLCSKVTIPAFGRDLLWRSDAMVVSVRNVSPTNTGRGR